jgi:hypothetical protein
VRFAGSEGEAVVEEAEMMPDLEEVNFIGAGRGELVNSGSVNSES